MSHHVWRDQHGHGVLQGDGAHVRSLMAVHPRFPTEFARLNRRDLARLTVLDHLQRDGARDDEVDPIEYIALVEEPFTGAEGQRPGPVPVFGRDLRETRELRQQIGAFGLRCGERALLLVLQATCTG